MAKNTKKNSVSIVILTTNALEMTRQQLANVAKLDARGIQATCIVVDNNSSDGTEKALKDLLLPNMKYKFIQSGANLGFAGGNNVGIKYALQKESQYVILMNNDLILPEDILIKLVRFMNKNITVGLASPKMYFAKGYEFHKDRYKKSELGKVIWYAGGLVDWKNVYSSHKGVDEVDAGQFDKVEATDFANGACVIIRSQVFKKIGLMDADLFLYWEDADFSTKARKAGFEVCYVPDTHLWHMVSSSTGGSGSPTNDYFITRNRYYFALRYARLRTKFAVFRDTLRLIYKGRKWQKWGAIDALLGRKGMGQWANR